MHESLPSDEPTTPGFDRRRFIQRAAITGAVAVPVVSSFSMAGVNSAFAQATNVSGKTTTTESGVSPTSEVTTTTAPATTTTTAPSTTTTTTVTNLPPPA